MGKAWFALLTAVCCLFLPLQAKTTIHTKIKTTEAKIKRTSEKLKNYDQRYKNAHYKLNKSAKAILKEQQKMLELDKKLEELTDAYNNNKTAYTMAQDKLVDLQQKKEELHQTTEETRTELSRLLAKQLSLKMILRQRSYSDAQALMRQEIFSSISRLTNEELKNVKTEISRLLDQESDMSEGIKTLSQTITKIDTQRQEIITLQESQKKVLKALNLKRLSYKRDLEKSLNTKESLAKMLRQLKIIKVDQVKEAKRKEAERKRRLAEAKKAGTKGLNSVKVVKRDSSYEQVKTGRYRGTKTIAPLKNYRVVKKFGPYKDPIYNIKIFNDSVSLKPDTQNAIVRAVLNGKVMISKRNNLLGNFIILSHGDGLHTVYAHLDKVAPNIRQGKRVAKGSAIGRVNDELMFQVTQKNKHIDPLQMFK